MPLLWKRAVMQECLKIIFELDKATSSDVFSNFARQHIANVVVSRDVVFPWILSKLLHA